MKVLILFALGLAAVVADPVNFNKSGQRIVGGSETTIQQYRYAAALQRASFQGQYYQAGSAVILTNRAALTAARCLHSTGIWDSPLQYQIRVGSSNANSGGVVVGINSWTVYPTYNPWTHENDVAILHTSSAINASTVAGVASIAGPNYIVYDNQFVYTVGWGATSPTSRPSEQLRYVETMIVNQATCRANYNAVGMMVTDNMLCSGSLSAGGRDACYGDYGSPLIHNNVIVGIYSWGLSCGLAQYPGVYSSISRFSPWIQQNA